MTRVGIDTIVDLETLFGDPTEPDGVFSHSAIMAADAERMLVPHSEKLLDDWGFGAEFVPRKLGGRWGSTEDLVRRLLPIFRRDPALGLGHGITTLMGAANVWVSGNEVMQRDVAAALCSGERIAVAFHELMHGNDLLRNECTAVHVDEPVAGWRVDGHKEVINNIDRAESALLFVRTADEEGPRSFSLLLWRKAVTTSGAADTSRRILTSGMRGCRIGSATFEGLVLPESSVVGAPGDGASTALRAFQVTRAVIPALATATLDAAIRLAVPYMRGRKLYGAAVWDLPHARMLLGRAWAALLIADSLARSVVRVLHVRPDESLLASAAAKYLVPTMLNDALQDLSVLFGSSFYAVTSPYGIVEKWLRDLIVVPIGHAGSTSCLLTLIPNLPTWARRARRDAVFESTLFSSAVQLDELSFEALELGVGRVDSLTAPLRSEDVLGAFRAEHSALVPLVEIWCDEFVALRDAAASIPPSALGSDASSEGFDLADRLTAAMAAGALLGTWYAARFEPTSPFSRGPAAITAALVRLAEDRYAPGSGEREPFVWTQEIADAAAAHVADRVDQGCCLGTEELPLLWNPSTQPDPKE